MVKLENISLKFYGPQRLVAGDVFEATEQHANLLVMIGKCRRYRDAIEKPTEEYGEPIPVVYGVANVSVESVEISPRTGKPKRQYKRKDMVAE